MVRLPRIAKPPGQPGEEYGRGLGDPEFLPDDVKQAVLKEARMGRAIEWVIAEPNPTTTGLAQFLRVSRATAYRMLAHPRFQVMLREALSGL